VERQAEKLEVLQDRSKLASSVSAGSVRPQDSRRKWVDGADVFVKISVGIAALVASLYLGVLKQWSDRDAQCATAMRGVFESIQGKRYSGGVINEIVHYWIPNGCTPEGEAQRDGLKTTLVQLAASDSQPQAQSTQQPEGWVAVGFLNSSDFNFDSYPAGTKSTALPVKDAIIRSKWDVNVREQAADWRNVRGVLRTSQCFTVAEARLLSAGAQSQQIWARGKKSDCK
jgi:hypothetical protein